MKSVLFLLFSCLICQKAIAQSGWKKHLGQELQIGTGGMLSGDTDIDGKHKIDFYLLNTKLSISVAARTHLGYRNYLLVEHPPGQDRARFVLHGPYAQYDFINKSGFRLWAESGYMFADYCSCGEAFARRRAKSNFALLGMGVSGRVFDRVSAELSGRKGYYVPQISGVAQDDLGFFIHFGIIYSLLLR